MNEGSGCALWKIIFQIFPGKSFPSQVDVLEGWHHVRTMYAGQDLKELTQVDRPVYV
jgi:hypothetical protein